MQTPRAPTQGRLLSIGRRLTPLSLAITVVVGCGHAPAPAPRGEPPREAEGGPVRLSTEGGLVWVSILGTNDIHGGIRERAVAVDNGTTKARLRVGGVATMKAYFDVARALNPGNTLIVDSGDIYQGSYLSNRFKGIPVVHALDAIGLSATAFGNHEWDFGQDAARAIVAEARYEHLSSNVVSEGEDRLLGYPKTISPHRVYCLPLGTPCEKAAARVGVIGATTDTTPAEADPRNLKGMTFLPLAERVMAAAQALRDKEKVNLVVLIAHSGGTCDMSRPAERGDEACPKSPITDMLDAMRAGPLHDRYPLGGVDAVLAGHVHAPQAHFIRGVPVVQNKDKGRSFSKIDFVVDPRVPADAPREKRVPRTVISRPTYFCRDQLTGYPSCVPRIDEEVYGGVFPAYPRGDLGAVVAARWGNHPIAVDEAVNQSLEPHYGQVKSLLEDPIVTLPKAPLVNDRFHESPMGNCLADALREQVKHELGQETDVLITHSGGIRETLPEPEVTFDDVFNVLPFDGTLSIVEMTGAEIEQLGLTLSQSPKNIAVISAGFKIRLSKGGAAPWHRGYVGPDGQPLARDRTYRVLTSTFNTKEGISKTAAMTEDVFKKAREQGRVHELAPLDRDLFIRRLKRKDVPLPASCTGGPLDRTVYVEG